MTSNNGTTSSLTTNWPNGTRRYLRATSAAGVGLAPGVNTSINTVLFVWGPGRIVPVRVTALTVTERLYDVALNPTRAEVQITLRVLTQEELNHDRDKLAGLARAANTYSQGLRQALAVANLVNAGESVVGMLPI